MAENKIVIKRQENNIKPNNLKETFCVLGTFWKVFNFSMCTPTK